MCKLLYIIRYLIHNCTTMAMYLQCIARAYTHTQPHYRPTPNRWDSMPGKRFHLCWLHGIIRCILKFKKNAPFHALAIDRRLQQQQRRRTAKNYNELWICECERTKCCHELIKIWLTLVVNVLQLIEFVSRAAPSICNYLFALWLTYRLAIANWNQLIPIDERVRKKWIRTSKRAIFIWVLQILKEEKIYMVSFCCMPLSFIHSFIHSHICFDNLFNMDLYWIKLTH